MGYTHEEISGHPASVGSDFRTRVTDAVGNLFGLVLYSSNSTRDMGHEVEVQAFFPALAGNGTAEDAIVALVVGGPEGDATIMLSPDEAQQIALSLLASSRQAEHLTKMRRFENRDF